MTKTIRLYDNTRVSTAKACLRKFLFEHVYGWRPDEKSVALIFGSAWHKAMDVVWRAHGENLEDRKVRASIVEEASNAFVLEWVTNGMMHPDELTPDDLENLSPRTPQIAEEMLHGYIIERKHIFADKSFKLLAVEAPFAVPLDPNDPSLFYVGRHDKQFEYRREVMVGEHKCLGRGTPVMLFDGTLRAVEDVKVGDLLMGPDSQPRRVSKLYSGRDNLYRVTQKNGDSYVVNSAHILSTKIAPGPKFKHKGETLREDDLFNLPITDFKYGSTVIHTRAHGWKASIDFPTLSGINPDLPAYLLGAWLGDGTAANQGITLGAEKKAVLAELEAYADKRSLKITVQTNKNKKCPTYQLSAGNTGQRIKNPLLTALQTLNLLNNKHVPHAYKTASRAARLDLLAGFIDTDGSLQQNGGQGYRISQKSKQIVEGIAFVARSLGFGVSYYLRKSRCMTPDYEFEGDYYWLYISGPTYLIPCRVAKKRAEKKARRTDPLRTSITVEADERGEYFGFELEGPDHLFLLGDFTVTHNTTTSYKKGAPFRTDFVDGFDVNSQIDGYIYALRSQYRERAKGVWVDGALVHKTEHEGFLFIPENRTEAALDSWLWETHYWIDQIEGNKLAYAERKNDDTPYLAAFPRNTNSCLQYGRCQFFDVCRVTTNPAKLEGPPLGYHYEPWSPFDTIKLEKLGFTVEGSGEPLKTPRET